MDDFLGNHHTQGKRRIKKGKQLSGLEQLDEVRKGLGPAKVGRNDQFSVLKAEN
jgi:protein LTV1